ncbi:hypothetical protein KS4_02000 [Poriferisphaera corsica]|uniref:PEP-CTERM protein-sorting domain-containing protein n=1 Tax=Poriferisphaera corsica TaxID=2528020 RepID=A0A517YPM1_9BACT|nr:PEP-CTERM sorting domain-containing protein [Poriferisphaera corsica]QDU32171.1 hypothetical protein KS4_02000 [Poriferisphaera corsica]
MKLIKTILPCAITALALTATSHAAPLVILHPDAAQHPNVAVAIQGIEVDGITYTANFNPRSSSFVNKFNNIWDPNGDTDYSDGITGLAPVFFDNEQGAYTAADQIETALSNFLMTHDEIVTDSFIIPFAHRTSDAHVRVLFDTDPDNLITDDVQLFNLGKTGSLDTQHVWVTFTPVPEPTSFALLSLTALPLITRRKRNA